MMEEKINLSDMNRIVDGKIKDLLHHPSSEKVFVNLTTDEEGYPTNVAQLKEMTENEQYLRDLIFDQIDVHKFTAECDSIAEQTYSLAKEKAQQFEILSKSMEQHNELITNYNAKRDQL